MNFYQKIKLMFARLGTLLLAMTIVSLAGHLMYGILTKVAGGAAAFDKLSVRTVSSGAGHWVHGGSLRPSSNRDQGVAQATKQQQ